MLILPYGEFHLKPPRPQLETREDKKRRPLKHTLAVPTSNQSKLGSSLTGPRNSRCDAPSFYRQGSFRASLHSIDNGSTFSSVSNPNVAGGLKMMFLAVKTKRQRRMFNIIRKVSKDLEDRISFAMVIAQRIQASYQFGL
jgi:hypothetical protein